jgi:lipoate synthase
MGFLGVASGPLVRSSFEASHLFPQNTTNQGLGLSKM